METLITDEGLPWTTEDESRWNNFLRGTTGGRLLPKLMESAPILLGKGETNEIMIRSGEFRGFSLAVKILLDMTHSAPVTPPSTTMYPSLDDDSQWKDGPKLNDPNATII